MSVHDSDPDWRPSLPPTPVERWTRPLAAFLRMAAASGVVLLICTAVALAFANSPYAEDYHHFWETPVAFSFGRRQWQATLKFFVDDGLMTIFFFVIGLEIKREIV